MLPIRPISSLLEVSESPGIVILHLGQFKKDLAAASDEGLGLGEQLQLEHRSSS